VEQDARELRRSCGMPPGPVRHLPADTASAVRAHARLASVERIAVEIAEYALVGGATRLDIQVDLTRWRLICIHNRQDRTLRAQGFFLDLYNHSLEQAPILDCLPWIGLLEVHTGAERSWTVLQRVRRRPLTQDHHVLYAGPSSKRPRRDTQIIVHDLWWRMPVRRHMARSRERRIQYRIRQALARLALAYPKVHLRAPGMHLRPANLHDRVRALVPSLDHVRTMHTRCTFSADNGVWQATMEGVVGRAAESLRCLFVNGQLVPMRTRDTLAWMSTCPVDVPWLPALAHAWDDSTRLYQQIEQCLAPNPSLYVLHVHVQRVNAPAVPLANWAALLHCLLSKPAPPAAAPLTDARVEHTRSPYFSSSAPITMRRMVRTDTLPPSLPLLLPDTLPSVRAIAQVDQKYLVCVCGGHNSEPLSLLCLDQHAVDERVRLETLTTSYVRACQRQEGHNVPLSVPVSMHPVPFPGICARMKFWGWEICVDASASTCTIHAVPWVLTAQQQRSRKELSICAAACAAWIAETEQPVSMEHFDTPLAALRFMPPALRQALEASACHKAIRFNQPLAHEQMERLLRQWTEVAFPFQCAHGRYVWYIDTVLLPCVYGAHCVQHLVIARCSGSVSRKWPQRRHVTQGSSPSVRIFCIVTPRQWRLSRRQGWISSTCAKVWRSPVNSHQQQFAMSMMSA